MKIIITILSNLMSFLVLYTATIIIMHYYNINDIGINNGANNGFAFFIILPILLIIDFIFYKFALFFIKYIRKENRERELKVSTKVLTRFCITIFISFLYIGLSFINAYTFINQVI